MSDAVAVSDRPHPGPLPRRGEGEERAEAVVVGGGPAGLAAAVELRRLGAGRVVLVDREEQAGGIPRHAAHTGFGLRDMHRLLTGPAYAARYVRLAQQAGVEVRTGTTVSGWSGPTTLSLTSPAGLAALAARVIILATGCRERPRAARLVPGDRPAGVLTTGALQQLVYLHRLPVGHRAVIVGAEHVSFSAVMTLAHAGVSTVAMITEHPRHQTYLPYKWLSSTRYGVPILTNHRVTGIVGRRRVEAVDVTELHTGSTRRLDCDTVVFTGDWIPDHELARRAGLLMDDATRAPRVDGALRTSVRGVFAAGNLLHAAETADIAALGGRHAARSARQFLENCTWPETPPIPIVCEPPLLWISPSAVTPGAAPPRGCFVLRVHDFYRNIELVVSQGSRVLWSQHYRRLTPNLPFYVASSWGRDVDAAGETVRFRLEHAKPRPTSP